MVNLIGFVLLSLSIFSLYAEENLEGTSSPKKYKFSICTLFKNEAKYLREWLEYHRLIGVDHFYLYNNGSWDRSVHILQPYINGGLVTLIYWPDRIRVDNEEQIGNWALSTQLPAYENAVKYAALNETEWILMLDVDEFLVPVEQMSVSEVLEDYEAFAGLHLSSDYFDAAYVDVLPRRELLIANVELVAKPAENFQKSIHKTIFKPDCQLSFYWPPYRCNFKEGCSETKLSHSKLRINKYVNRNANLLHPAKIREKLRVDNRLLTECQKNEILDHGFGIEDSERPIYRFEFLLRKKLGLDAGYN